MRTGLPTFKWPVKKPAGTIYISGFAPTGSRARKSRNTVEVGATALTTLLTTIKEHKICQLRAKMGNFDKNWRRLAETASAALTP